MYYYYAGKTDRIRKGEININIAILYMISRHLLMFTGNMQSLLARKRET